MLFDALDDRERHQLATRLRRAGERFGDEANMLAAAPADVIAAYHMTREGYHDWYSAAIESSILSVEVWKRPEPVWAPEPARIVPTGTGWPVT